ncbi:MAG: UDP-N-acetylmuramoyl-tripeptide--D-alanyl-D-alanine ligase [Firmicutes bacterium HGW-Firmicutes-15]|nr:MAG: UDP-N-acetylmuramoyl-tripeptide--D-alanyl-D-alanine ligase [Firmicutes bacterium HGW-Firmicutes-15]
MVVKSPNMLTLNKWNAADIAIVEVQNLSRAYRSLAMFYRDQFSIPFIQVIGSSGKTTTKEMIGSVLNEKFPTLTSLKNMNSPTGVAKNLFRLNKTPRAAVLEAGMKASGIIRTATRLIKPDIGVITSIHSAHLTRLGSIQNIIAAKAEIFEYLSKDGCMIVNWDDPNCQRLPFHRYHGKLLRFGFSEECDLWASDIQRQGFRTNFKINTKDLQFACTINIVGRYNVGNALAATAVGLKMGLSPMEIAHGLEQFNPVNGRLKVYHRSDGAVVIDDTYNANPDSTRLLIDELIIMAREQPVVLVIGDMERPSRDIENYARSVHFNIGQQLAQGAFQHVMAIGLWASEYVRGAIQAGFPQNKISYYETVRAAETSFKYLITPGTTVVLKASTYTKLKHLDINDYCSC